MTTDSAPIVYLVDDEDAIRDSLTIFLESEGLDVKSYSCPIDFLDGFCHDQPGCLVLDVRMPGMDGLDLQDELTKRRIRIPIIFISGHAQVPDSARAFRAGAVDFLEKPFDGPLLLERVREAIQKDIDAAGKRIMQRRIDQLTMREKQVLLLVADGYSSKEIGKLLQLSNRTVEAHRAHIMEKLQANSVADLVMLSMQCQLPESDFPKKR